MVIGMWLKSYHGHAQQVSQFKRFKLGNFLLQFFAIEAACVTKLLIRNTGILDSEKFQ
jgi:hypothetical protein